jgi:hypothetical protein
VQYITLPELARRLKIEAERIAAVREAPPVSRKPHLAQQPSIEDQAATDPANLPMPLGPRYSAADLAGLLGQAHAIGRVESFLRRYREKYPDCCECGDYPRKNEARILYRTADVWPVLLAQLPRWQQRDG